MRRLVALVAALALGAGCAPHGTGGAFRVALVTAGPVSDAGWNAAAWEGLERIERELGAEVAHQEAGSPAEFEEAFRDFARRGFRLVFGHGFEFQDAATSVGAEFPGTAFVVTSGLAVRENVAGLVFRLEEATYLAGVLAAHLTRTGTVGMVGGMDIPPVRLAFAGFREGFLAERPDGAVREVYLGSWEDVAAGRQAALALAAQGADVVIHNADAAGLGVFQACREAGILAVGTNRDQAPVAPEVVVASAVIRIPEAMVRVAREVREGRFRGRVIAFDLASGVVDLEVNPELEPRIPREALAAVDRARAAVTTGEVRLPRFGP